MDIMKSIEILPSVDQIQVGFRNVVSHGIQIDKAGSSLLIGILAVSILVCFLGLNIRKVWTALAGLLTGVCLGYYAGLSFGAEKMIALAIGAAAGIILLILTIFLNTVGIFLMCLLLAAYTGVLLLPSGNMINIWISLGIGAVIALISLKLKDPMTIVCTVAAGSITGGIAAMQLFALKEGYYQYIISAAMAVIGLIIQILCASRKVARQDIKKAKEIKAQKSVENEVEAARAILEEEEAEPEEVYVDILPEEPAALAEEQNEAEELLEEELLEDELLDEEAEPLEEEFPEEEITQEVKLEAEAEGSEDENEEPENAEAMPEEAEEALTPEEEAARARQELEAARRELERMKQELEEAKKGK